MSIQSRVKQLENQSAPQLGTWKDFITGVWTPAPAQWAAFIAMQKPSDILARVDELLDRARARKEAGEPPQSDAGTLSAETQQRIDSLRRIVKG